MTRVADANAPLDEVPSSVHSGAARAHPTTARAARPVERAPCRRRRKNTSRRRCASRELSLWSIPRLESPPRPPFVLASSLTFVSLSSQIRPGAIVVAEGETAILVKYELEGQLYAPDGVTVITEKSNSVKKIKVKTLNASTDLDALAAEIVEKCKLIHHSKTSHVRDLLAKLRDRDAPDARVEAARAAKAQATARARATSDARASDASRRSSSPTAPSPSSSRRSSGGWGEAARERGRRSSRGGSTGVGSSSTPGDWLGEFASGGVDVVAEEMERLRVREEERMLAEAEEEGAFDAHASVPVHLPQCKAHIQDMDDYLERLYDEDMAVKVDATLHVAALAASGEPGRARRTSHPSADPRAGPPRGRAAFRRSRHEHRVRVLRAVEFQPVPSAHLAESARGHDDARD